MNISVISFEKNFKHFVYLKDRGGWVETDLPSAGSLSKGPQWLRLGPSQSLLSVIFHASAGTHTLGPSAASFPGTLAESHIGSRAART